MKQFRKGRWALIGCGGLLACIVIGALITAVDKAGQAVGVFPTWTPTLPPTLTYTPAPTATSLPTNTPGPTQAPTATETPEPPTVTPEPTAVPPTNTPYTCDCSGDVYNCKSFVSDWDAQQCYRYCLNQTGVDVHDLDRDSDGNACEWDG